MEMLHYRLIIIYIRGEYIQGGSLATIGALQDLFQHDVAYNSNQSKHSTRM